MYSYVIWANSPKSGENRPEAPERRYLEFQDLREHLSRLRGAGLRINERFDLDVVPKLAPTDHAGPEHRSRAAKEKDGARIGRAALPSVVLNGVTGPAR